MINCQRLRREFQVDFQLSFSEGDGIGRNVNLMLAKVIIEKVSAPPACWLCAKNYIYKNL